MRISPPPPGPDSVDIVWDIKVTDRERIREYLDTPSKICPQCKLTNFGRNKKCANWKCNFIFED